MNFYKKPTGWSSYTPNKIVEMSKDSPRSLVENSWIMARPEPYYSLIERLRQAWDVLTYQADTLYWGEPKNQIFGKGLKEDN